MEQGGEAREELVTQDEVCVFGEGDGVLDDGGEDVDGAGGGGGGGGVRGGCGRACGGGGGEFMQAGPAAKDCVSDFSTDTRMVSDAKRSMIMGRRRVT